MGYDSSTFKSGHQPPRKETKVGLLRDFSSDMLAAVRGDKHRAIFLDYQAICKREIEPTLESVLTINCL